jgi:cytochrome c1
MFLLASSFTAAADDKDAGKTVFGRVCEACHGVGASGGQGPALVPYEKELPELVAIVRQGIGLMPSIPRSQISDDEIAQVHAYLKSLGDEHAEQVARSEILTPLRRDDRGGIGGRRAAARAGAGPGAPAGHQCRDLRLHRALRDVS